MQSLHLGPIFWAVVRSQTFMNIFVQFCSEFCLKSPILCQIYYWFDFKSQVGSLNFCWTVLGCGYINSDFSLFFNFYKTLFQIINQFTKTGTTFHNLKHNPIRSQSPDLEFFLACRLVASSLIGARIALQDQCQVVLCLPNGRGLGPHTEVQIPCLLCGAFPRSSWFHFIIGLVRCSIFLLDFGTSE